MFRSDELVMEAGNPKSQTNELQSSTQNTDKENSRKMKDKKGRNFKIKQEIKNKNKKKE